MSRKSPEDFRDETSPETRGIAGLIRRMVITATRSVLWQITGHRLLDNTIETRDAPVFSGIGIYARPPANGKPEAIVVFPGSTDGRGASPLVAALRDEETRRAVFKLAGELAAGETAIFNPSAIIVIKTNGTVEIRSLEGTAHELALKSDVQDLRDWAAAKAYGGSGSVVPVGPAAPPQPTGTSKLKAE